MRQGQRHPENGDPRRLKRADGDKPVALGDGCLEGSFCLVVGVAVGADAIVPAGRVFNGACNFHLST